MLENPDLISRTVLAKGLDNGTAFEILSIDIADVDIGRNIGAHLQIQQAEADKQIAQAKAEERRATAIAKEQEMRAEVEHMKAKVVEAALRLDRHVHVVKDINELYKRADYITVHIHYTEKTRHMINAEAIGKMKRGVRVVNLARGEIVEDEAMLSALDTGKVACYVTDFPNNKLVRAHHVVAMPHLGASTPESEQNCAAMAVDELMDYLENGNIKNSVNFPNVHMDRSGVMRMCIINRNIPAMLANITALLAKDHVNVENMTNKSRGDYAYTMVDLGAKVDENVIRDVEELPGVIRVRVIE